MSRSLLDRFMAKVELPAEPDGCWIWLASSGKGYGRIWAGRYSTGGHPLASPAHVVAYELAVGPIPVGHELDHICRRKSCVNPDHLEPVSHRENVLRGDSPFAARARQTHCKRGHVFDVENTYVWRGMRQCRACDTERQRRQRCA